MGNEVVGSASVSSDAAARTGGKDKTAGGEAESSSSCVDYVNGRTLGTGNLVAFAGRAHARRGQTGGTGMQHKLVRLQKKLPHATASGNARRKRHAAKAAAAAAAAAAEADTMTTRWRCADVDGRVLTLTIPQPSHLILNEKVYSPMEHAKLEGDARRRVEALYEASPASSTSSGDDSSSCALARAWETLRARASDGSTHAGTSNATMSLESLADTLLSDTSDAGVYTTYLSVLESERNHYFALISGGRQTSSPRSNDVSAEACTGVAVQILSEKEVSEKRAAREERMNAVRRRIEVFRGALDLAFAKIDEQRDRREASRAAGVLRGDVPEDCEGADEAFAASIVCGDGEIRDVFLDCISEIERIACLVSDAEDASSTTRTSLTASAAVVLEPDTSDGESEESVVGIHMRHGLHVRGEIFHNDDVQAMYADILLECYRRHPLPPPFAATQDVADVFSTSPRKFNARHTLRDDAEAFLVDIGYWTTAEPIPVRRAQAKLWTIESIVRDKVREILDQSQGEFVDDTAAPASSARTDMDTVGDTGHVYSASALNADRADLSYMPAYCIDDPWTLEVDDAVSFERLSSPAPSPSALGHHCRIWIHVADPARLVPASGEIDYFARSRGTTLYLPSRVATMFPFRLATGPMSLMSAQGGRSSALSVGIELDARGCIVGDKTIVTKSFIAPVSLSYDTVNAMLRDGAESTAAAESGSGDDVISDRAHTDVSALRSLALMRRSYRDSRGAMTIGIPMCRIHVADDADSGADFRVNMFPYSFDDPARELVAELMIAAGEAVAQVGAQNDIPLPFRCQPHHPLAAQHQETIAQTRESHASTPASLSPAVLASSWKCRNSMPHGEHVPSSPSAHGGLGVDQYLQFTSPIRRYNDFIAHAQFDAFLGGRRLPFETDRALSTVLSAAMTGAKRLKTLQRETERYWGAHYFLERSRRNASRTWSAVLLGWHKRNFGAGMYSLGIVYLPEVGYEGMASIDDHALEPGATLSVRCQFADPTVGKIMLSQQQHQLHDDEEANTLRRYDVL